MLSQARDIRLTISYFPCAIPPGGPALGDPECATWHHFAHVISDSRREGDKDGPGFVPSRFTLEPDGRRVRRLKANLAARTAIALDIETNKKTGEIPRNDADVIARIRSLGLAAILYSSHNHRPAANPRYRIVFPLTAEISPEVPAPQIMAAKLSLDGVTDTSKYNAAAFFYLPSCSDNATDGHFCKVLEGAAVDAEWITAEGDKILAAQEAEAQAAAAARQVAKLASGVSSEEDSLIEKLRDKLDHLEDILAAHGYEKLGGKFKHPNSSSGCFGANIKTLGGIERVFSHNATDPLHADNLPAWCNRVTAIDAFDVTAILYYGGDRKRALVDLAKRYGLAKTEENKALAALIFRMVRRHASQAEIESAARTEGAQLGLSWDEVCRVALWVRQKSIEAPRAA